MDELEVHEERASDVDCKNGNDVADLDHDIAKAGDELERMGDKETELMATIKSLKEIATSNTSLAGMLNLKLQKKSATSCAEVKKNDTHGNHLCKGKMGMGKMFTTRSCTRSSWPSSPSPNDLRC